LYYKLTPEFTASVHRNSRDYIKLMLKEKKNMPAIVITHHSPSFMSINEKYQRETDMNGAYASDLSDLILDHENIRVWVHGHMHDAVDYSIGNTRVLSNPRGYVGDEDTSGFDPSFSFNV
jgi:Icc-related predicted phosphoesterase